MKPVSTEIDCLSIYERMAASYFNDLKQLKAQRAILDEQIKEVESCLTRAEAHGDLGLWQDPENKNTYRYDGNCYVFCAGRVSYNYSDCEEVKAAEDNLRELKSAAAASGEAQRKQGKPFWSVR